MYMGNDLPLINTHQLHKWQWRHRPLITTFRSFPPSISIESGTFSISAFLNLFMFWLQCHIPNRIAFPWLPRSTNCIRLFPWILPPAPGRLSPRGNCTYLYIYHPFPYLNGGEQPFFVFHCSRRYRKRHPFPFKHVIERSKRIASRTEFDLIHSLLEREPKLPESRIHNSIIFSVHISE